MWRYSHRLTVVAYGLQKRAIRRSCDAELSGKDARDSLLPSEHWAAVARAAADARRFREDGLAGCYGDTSLWASAGGHVRGVLRRAITGAIDTSPGCRRDLLDALQAGDPDLDGCDLGEMLEEWRRGKEALREFLRGGSDPELG